MSRRDKHNTLSHTLLIIIFITRTQLGSQHAVRQLLSSRLLFVLLYCTLINLLCEHFQTPEQSREQATRNSKAALSLLVAFLIAVRKNTSLFQLHE